MKLQKQPTSVYDVTLMLGDAGTSHKLNRLTVN